MTALPNPRQPDTPERRREKTERLLRQASAWTPDTPPGDFIERAQRRIERELPARRRMEPHARLWWGLGTISTAGVAAACALFALTGRMPVLERATEAPLEPFAARTTETTETTETTGSTKTAGQESRPSAEVGSPDSGQTDSPESFAAARKRPGKGTAETADRVTARAERAGRVGPATLRRTASRPKPRYRRSYARLESRDVRKVGDAERESAKLAPENATSGKKDAPVAAIAATAAPEVYATEDGRVLVPVVITQTSPDGTEVSYTPAVVEMAYQPANTPAD
ncbi:MAG: hypothetical protein SFU56_08740 [Capsulimonadales bacterium]|nr:hypothetical protein [Capsulimonadales bacterium]